MVAKRKKNNETRLALEPQLASSLLYYDNDEFEIFNNYWNEILNIQEVTPSEFMLFLVDSLKTIFKSKREKLLARDKIIEEVKMLNEVNPSSIGREQFAIWFDSATEINAPENFDLAGDLFYRYLWACYKDLVEYMDDAPIPFQDKLTIRPIKANLSDTSKPIIRISDISKSEARQTTYTTGIPFLDDKVQPKDSNFMVIAARPSVGKSVFLLRQALENAAKGIPCLFISLEMTSEQIEQRIMCWYKKRFVNDSEFEAIKKEKGFQVINENFMLMANKTNNTDVIIDYVHNAIEDYGVQIVLIDYLQLLRYPLLDEWASLRKVTHQLKQLAVQQNILVVSCSQVARSTKDTGLDLESLFGSSSIESDTDLIIGLESTGKKNIDDSDSRILHMSILKNRQGLKDKRYKVGVKYISMEFEDLTS